MLTKVDFVLNTWLINNSKYVFMAIDISKWIYTEHSIGKE
jgi:hypothetical protein